MSTEERTDYRKAPPEVLYQMRKTVISMYKKETPVEEIVEITGFCERTDLSIASDNPIIRMFAIVDRRIGKRTLERLKDEIPNQPEWLKPLYVERMKADGVLKEGEQR